MLNQASALEIVVLMLSKTAQLVVAGLLVAACGIGAQQERGLSRAEAKSVIATDQRFAVTSTLSLVDPQQSVSGGIREGLWIDQGLKGLALTPVGYRYFTQAQGFSLAGYTLALVQPARREVVEVTGIADAPVGRNIKEVNFRWRYVALPDVVARYTGQGQATHDSKALLRLYDDGWRLEQLMLTESGRSAFGGVPTSVLRREADAEESFLRDLQQSTRPERLVGEFILPSYGPGAGMSRTARVTDVGVSLEQPGGSPSKLCWWFGQLHRIEVRRTSPGYQGILLPVKDSSRFLTLDVSENALGDFHALATALMATHNGWNTKYKNIAARLTQFNFAEITRRARPEQLDWLARGAACEGY